MKGRPCCATRIRFVVATVFQEFGTPEATLVTCEGGIRIPYWHQSVHADIRKWAEGTGADLLWRSVSRSCFRSIGQLPGESYLTEMLDPLR